MLRRQNLGTLLLLGVVAEIVAFIAVVDWIGAGPAVLLGIGSTLLGAARLKRLGGAAFTRLRAVAEGRVAREDAFVDGALDGLGGALLILPGFITDAIGLALLAPSCRDWVKHRVGFTTGRSPARGPNACAPRPGLGPSISRPRTGLGSTAVDRTERGPGRASGLRPVRHSTGPGRRLCQASVSTRHSRHPGRAVWMLTKAVSGLSSARRSGASMPASAQTVPRA